MDSVRALSTVEGADSWVPALLSGVGEGNLKTGVSEVGKAEKGPSLLTRRLMGGRPRVLPLELVPPLRHADETTFAPCRLTVDLGFDWVMADFGSSAQNVFLVEGVIADWGIG
jgi:hypothetical protein